MWLFMDVYKKAKFHKSFKYGFVSKIKIILPAHSWWNMTAYAGLVNKEGVGLFSSQNDKLWQPMRVKNEIGY